MKNLDREHLYVIKSEIGIIKAFSDKELETEIAKLNLLKIRYEIIKLW